MQALRLVGMPDKIIAFDELPEELVRGLEMREPIGPSFRAWRDWLGKKTRVTKVSPERDPHTHQIRTFDPIVEEGSYFYIVDEEMNADMEKWDAICSYVRANCPKEFRLKDNIKDMAIALAGDVRSDVSIEPEEVTVIPLPKLRKEIPITTLVTPNGQPYTKENPATQTVSDDAIKEMSHDSSCKSQGRGGRYSDNCKKCELMKLKRETVSV